MRWTLPQAEGKLGALQRALGKLLIFTKFAVYTAGWVYLGWDVTRGRFGESGAVGIFTTLFFLDLLLCWLASSACSILHRILVGPVPEKWKLLTRSVGLSMLMFWLSVNFRSFNFRECNLPTCENWWALLLKPLF